MIPAARRQSIRSLVSLVLLAAAACGGGGSASSSEPVPVPNEVPGECDESFDSTFSAIQTVIFEREGCTEDACHGSARSGGLDLRPDVAYTNLIEVPSTSSSHPRIQPGEPGESFLYLKLLAATEPENAPSIGG